MPSIQDQIVARVQELLLASGSAAADRVFRSRTEALQRGDTPAVVIRPDLETTEAQSDEVDRNQFEMTVEILAREETTGARRSWDAVADDVRVRLHVALLAEGAFSQADKVQRFYVDWLEEEGDNTAGNCMVRYRFTYLCTAADLTSSPTFY